MANINIRVDDELKEDSRIVLESLGMDLSTGIKVFLNQVVATNGIPFDVKLSELDISLKQVERGQTTRVTDVSALMKSLDD